MVLNEITENGQVIKLEVEALSLEIATIIANQWCENNNSILKNVIPEGERYIVEVCSDDSD
jgi:hypothetical protein